MLGAKGPDGWIGSVEYHGGPQTVLRRRHRPHHERDETQKATFRQFRPPSGDQRWVWITGGERSVKSYGDGGRAVQRHES